MLSFLSDHLATVALLAFLLLSVLVLGLVMWAAAQGADRAPSASPPGPAARVSLQACQQSFHRAVELIETHLAVRSERYNLSWTLVLDAADTEQPLPLASAGIASAMSTEAMRSLQAHGIAWRFFDKGVAVQVPSPGLGAESDASSPEADLWDPFLSLCRRYRPDRPFDALVVSVPAALLMDGDASSGLDLATRAKVIQRRLWLAQHRFALQFPVYLVVSGCEAIPGFTAFARALPPTLHASMLGWSSPYELDAPFQPTWIDTGMDEVTRDVQDACAELCALAPAGHDSAEYFMLPAQLDTLRRSLQIFTEELMLTPADHESFLLRGFYFTGDCSDAAALHAAAADASPSPVPEAAASTEGEIPAPKALDTAPPLAPEPAFLRDLFERKIFAEPGLVRASRMQHLQRPVVGRALRWTAVALPAVWAIGLVVSTLRLSQLGPDLVAAVHELDRHERATGEPVDAVRDRTRALGTLALIEHVEGGRFGAIAMPGSWALWDDLQERLRLRLERSFSDNAIEPLRLGAYARISELTGVPTDPATGTLINGSTCALPPAWTSQTAGTRLGGLNVEDLPEFAALLEFAGRLEALDRGVRALGRLAHSHAPASGEDLRIVVRVFLGAEVTANLDRAAALLRQQSQSRVRLALAPLQQATRCSFSAATHAVHERLFDRNDLLRAEQGIDALARSLSVASGSVERGAMQQGWTTMLDALRKQESWMVPGKGAWMQRATPELGQAYDGLLQRMQVLELVGPEAVAHTQRQTQEAFDRFRGQWDLMRVEGTALLGAGLVWQDKDGRWGFTPERAALRDALSALLAQPYMKSAQRTLPEAAANQALAWDRAKLEQALALADLQRKAESQLWVKFPPTVRASVAEMMRSALADGMVDLLAQSLMVLPVAAAPAVAEADRLRLVRATSVLGELGAHGAATRLSRLLARDALSRLRRLDDTLRQGDFYAPREPDFRSWGGEKAPLPAAFGAGDAAGLMAYAAHQQAFIDALARDADALLPALDGQGSSLLVQRWRGITADLARYRLKSPASSLALLEQFVTATAAEVDLSNCADKLKLSPRRVGDVFAERLVALQTGLLERCRDLRQSQSRLAWNQFAEAFNRDLAARAPFRAAGGGADRAPADAEETGAVLQAFEQAQRLLPIAASVSEPVRRFGEQMERVRAFMAPLYPAQPEAAAGYDVAVEFRVNRAHEQQGHTIIDWRVTVGGQTLRARDAARPLRWEPGMPIEVRLRLARDGPVAPLPEPGQRAMAIDEPREVRYRYTDPWALISLLAAQREAEGAARSDARSQLLKFEFPLAAVDPAAALTAEAARARVYLRVLISPAGKRVPLPWPGAFPVRAPQWSTP